jgi:raffinose/stachyose/melibiose transport system substrate-binding protein
LEYVPLDGVYAVPYMSNAAGVLYNKDMFEENGWEIPTTWDEFIALCEEIQETGIYPLYFGYKDTWTCLAPWNAIAVNLCPSDIAYQVNSGNATFSEYYAAVAEMERALLDYAEPNPVAYGYNDACTAFARGESAMYVIGNYAIPQIKSVNPDMNIDSFVFPASNDASENILNSGNDLMFCVMEDCENKEAAYEVLRFLLEDENVQAYIDDQSAVPCKKGDFTLPAELDGMKDYINNGIIADYQDHHYPSEMSVDAMIQTFLLDTSDNALDTFMKRFDTEWVRYNKDVIAKVKKYEEGGN